MSIMTKKPIGAKLVRESTAKKNRILAIMAVLMMGITACSSEPKESADSAEVIVESPVPQAIEGSTETEPTNVEVSQGDPIVGIVEKYEDDIIVINDYDVLIYFSTKDAEVVEGDSPIAVGDIVEITYTGVQGDEEHPGIATKVVAESMMYQIEGDGE